MGTKGYDCLEIPGAAKGTMCEDFAATRLNANVFCGDSAGLATVMMAERGANSGTICSELHSQLYNHFEIIPKIINFLFGKLCTFDNDNIFHFS